MIVFDPDQNLNFLSDDDLEQPVHPVSFVKIIPNVAASFQKTDFQSLSIKNSISEIAVIYWHTCTLLLQ